jgi:hypothetical protein
MSPRRRRRRRLLPPPPPPATASHTTLGTSPPAQADPQVGRQAGRQAAAHTAGNRHGNRLILATVWPLRQGRAHASVTSLSRACVHRRAWRHFLRLPRVPWSPVRPPLPATLDECRRRRLRMLRSCFAGPPADHPPQPAGRASSQQQVRAQRGGAGEGREGAPSMRTSRQATYTPVVLLLLLLLLRWRALDAMV